MPSPTSRTLPTSRDSTCSRYVSISDCRTETISSALNLMCASFDQLISNGGETALNRYVNETVADLYLQAPDQFGFQNFNQNRFQFEIRFRQLFKCRSLRVRQRRGRP